MIEPCTAVDQEGWLSLRRALWPHCSDAGHLAEMAEFLAQPERDTQFVAYAGSHQPAGFAEAETELSQIVHKALGFAETERVVYFRKVLPRNDGQQCGSSA
jgi:hypothetical protein